MDHFGSNGDFDQKVRFFIIPTEVCRGARTVRNFFTAQWTSGQFWQQGAIFRRLSCRLKVSSDGKIVNILIFLLKKFLFSIFWRSLAQNQVQKMGENWAVLGSNGDFDEKGRFWIKFGQNYHFSMIFPIMRATLPYVGRVTRESLL